MELRLRGVLAPDLVHERGDVAHTAPPGSADHTPGSPGRPLASSLPSKDGPVGAPPDGRAWRSGGSRSRWSRSPCRCWDGARPGAARRSHARGPRRGRPPSRETPPRRANGRTVPRRCWPSRDWEASTPSWRASASASPDLYAWYRLGYLHGRVKLARGEHAEARRMLEPFLAAGHPLRDLALHYAAAARGGGQRRGGGAPPRGPDPQPSPGQLSPARARGPRRMAQRGRRTSTRLRALTGRLAGPRMPPPSRDIESRVVVLTLDDDRGGRGGAGMRLLKANQGDDAGRARGPRAGPAGDPRRAAARGLGAPGGERAQPPPLRSRGRPAGAGPAGGRGQAGRTCCTRSAAPIFGAEQYEAAEKRYLEGAALPSSAEERGNFFYNAAAARSSPDDDARAERHLAEAITAGGKTSARFVRADPAAAPARVRAGRLARGRGRPAAVRKTFAKTHAVVEAALAYAAAMVEAGRSAEALPRCRRSLPRVLEKADVPEVEYWKARALEERSPGGGRPRVPEGAAGEHADALRVLRPAPPGPGAAGRPRCGTEAAARETRAAALAAKGDMEGARKLQTEAVLLSAARRAGRAGPPARDLSRAPAVSRDPRGAAADLSAAARCSGAPRPRSRSASTSCWPRACSTTRWRTSSPPTRCSRSAPAIARAEALRRAEAGRSSIFAIESALQLPEGLPAASCCRRWCASCSTRGTSTRTSRSRPASTAPTRGWCCRSCARSRGSTCARSRRPPRAGCCSSSSPPPATSAAPSACVDVDAQDLYEPRRDHPARRASTSATCRSSSRATRTGPRPPTTRGRSRPRCGSAWRRGPATTTTLTAVNFDETKDYVRKVLNSYERYGEIYESGPPSGGVRPEP